MAWISSDEAIRLLGVRPQTLYAYVSRGRLEARPDPDDPRRSLYSAEDVERLATRKSGPKRAAEIARASIAWGEPVLTSALTVIADGRLCYRGVDAIKLSDTATLEEAAALFWAAPYAPRATPPLQPMDRSRPACSWRLRPVRAAIRMRAAGPRACWRWMRQRCWKHWSMQQPARPAPGRSTNGWARHGGWTAMAQTWCGARWCC